LKLKVQHNPTLDYSTFLGVSDTFTVTYPLSGAGTVHSTDAFVGFLVSITPQDSAQDTTPMAEAVFQINSVTKTAQS
jgi:hypothetical protein